MSPCGSTSRRQSFILSDLPRSLSSTPSSLHTVLDLSDPFSSSENMMLKLSLLKLIVSLAALTKFSVAVPAEISARTLKVETETVSVLMSTQDASRVDEYITFSLKERTRHLLCLCR